MEERASGRVVVRRPGRGSDAFVDRAAEEHNLRAAARHGLAPELLEASPDGAFVTAHVDGPDLRESTLDDETIAAVGVCLRRLHDLGPRFHGSFDPFDVIDRWRDLAIELGAPLPPGFGRIVSRLEPRRRHLEDRRAAPTACHNDPWPGNLLRTRDGVLLVDWEYAGNGDPAWDLADFSVEAALTPADEEALLSAYGAEGALAERVALLAPVTDVLWTAWAAVQTGLGNEADDFVAYGERRLAAAAEFLDR